MLLDSALLTASVPFAHPLYRHVAAGRLVCERPGDFRSQNIFNKKVLIAAPCEHLLTLMMASRVIEPIASSFEAPSFIRGRTLTRVGRDCCHFRRRKRHLISKEEEPPQHPDPYVRAAFASDVPLRCPRSLIKAGLRRIKGLHTAEGCKCLRDGEAFVCPGDDLIGGTSSPLLKWDLDHLRKHLPKEMTWPVLHKGTGKIVMTHTNRYLSQADLDKLQQVEQAKQQQLGADERFQPVHRKLMTIDEYAKAAEAHAANPVGDPPYLTSDILWRNSMDDNGNIQNIGPVLQKELMGGVGRVGSGANFASLHKLQENHHLPKMKQVHLFVGSARTLYHCHYDLQPNLHVQLVGRKRFILCPPDQCSKLYPFPVHHNFDRRSQVDLDHPDETRFPGCTSANGFVVELEPNEMLYIPCCWWHHVQTLTTPCVSMAWWFYERLDRDGSPTTDPDRTKRPLDSKHFGMNVRARELMLSRWLEETVGKLLAPIEENSDVELGGEQAKKGGAMWSGPKKERAVAAWVRALAEAAEKRLVASLDCLEPGWYKDKEAELPPLQEGIDFELLEASLREHAFRELDESHAKTEEGADVDEWIVRSVRGRGF